ncbi:MAG: hypothetical protein RR706_07030 [Muribaculaceae bacterium]
MKKRLLYVAFTLLTVLGFASTAQAQNAYAYGLNGALSTDGTTINVNYRLNAAATGANIILTNGDKEVLSLPVEAANLVAGEHSIAIPVTNLPTGVDLKWKIEVKSAIAATPTVLPKAYRFYHPQGVVVDNNPKSANFGRILVTECMTVKDVIYQSGNAADGQGIYAFDPTMTPIKNKNGGFAFKGGMTYSETFTGLTKTSYDPRKIRITEDGRIFVTRQSNVDTPLMEVNPLDLDAPFVSVFQGTVDAATLETKDADGKFIASANVGFDVMGSGANLKLLMLSTNADGLGFSQSGFRTDEYNLGTAKTFSTVPTKSIVELSGQKTISYANASVQYDKEGGIWYVQYRGTPTHAEPAIIHINALGEEDYRDITTVAGGGGVCFNPDFTLIAITNKKKWVGIYEIGKDAAQKPTLTLKYEFDTTIGNNCNDIAWDVANNLYVVGNSGEWFKAFALPRATDAVTTPAMDKFAINIPAPVPPTPAGPALTEKWKITEGLPAAPDARQAAYKNGKLYIQNKATKTIQVWDAKGLTDEGYPSGAGTNITTDEAGNIIVRIGTFPNAFASDVAELRIISADGKITKDVTLSGIPAGRCDFFGKVKGNVLDAVDGGVLYLMIGGNQSITVVPIIDGVQNIDYTFQAPYDGALATSGVINAVGEKLVVYGRGAGNTIVEGAMEGEAFVKNRTYITPSHNAANGCTSFTMGGVEYILYTTSPNAKYGDGFAIAKASDVADNAIIVENVETINAKNGFQANWVFAEVVSDTKANIYQYYPGGYIAMYEFTTPAPEKADLYMIGQIAPNNYEWKANVGHKMDGGVDGIYTTTVRIAENATSDGLPAFGFATKLGANADDWATLNANRFGAAVDGTMVDNDTEAPLVKAEGALKIKGWEYLVTVNMKAMTVKCTATTPIPSETYPETLYVIGQIKPAEGDQWKTDDASYPLAKTGNEGEYKGTDIKLYGDAFFTLVSKLGATWDIVNPFRYGPAIANDVLVPEVAATVTVGATNSWKIIPAGYTLLVNLKNKTILASKTSGVDGVDAAAVKVIGGVGEINVIGEANSIEVFTAGGALVSKNETSVLCASGIYFVRVDGKITKVVVR